MKVAISTNGESLESSIDPRFGRSQYYLIYNTDDDTYESIINPSRQATGGAGIQAAQDISNMGVEAVITTNVGPNAFRVLEAAKIKVFSGVTGSVKKAVEDFKAGSFDTTASPTVGEKFGMGSGNARGGRE